MSNTEQGLEAASLKAVRPFTTHHENCPSETNQTCGTMLHMNEQRQDDQLEPTYISSVSIQVVAFKAYLQRWTIETCVG